MKQETLVVMLEARHFSDGRFTLLYHIASLVIGVIFLKFADSKYVEYEEKTTEK